MGEESEECVEDERGVWISEETHCCAGPVRAAVMRHRVRTIRESPRLFGSHSHSLQTQIIRDLRFYGSSQIETIRRTINAVQFLF